MAATAVEIPPADGGSAAAPAPAASKQARNLLGEYRVGAHTVVAQLAAAATGLTAGFQDSHGQTALVLCIEAGHEEAVVKLLEKEPPPSLSVCALTAATHGRTQLLERLARAGASLVETDAMGATPLHRAAENGHADVVKLLCSLGVPVDPKDVLQRTPLHLAVQAGAVACVVALLKAGADISAVDDLNRNAGDVAEALRAGGGKAIDEASLETIYDLFKDELEAMRQRLAGVDENDLMEQQPASHAQVFKLEHSTMQGMLEAAAAALVDATGPITGIQDLDTLVALLLAKFHGCVAQGLVETYADIYRVLDSAGDGHCSPGDLASGCLEMGIEIIPDLLPPLLERITGRHGAEYVTIDEFEAFCSSLEAAGPSTEGPVQEVAADEGVAHEVEPTGDTDAPGSAATEVPESNDSRPHVQAEARQEIAIPGAILTSPDTSRSADASVAAWQPSSAVLDLATQLRQRLIVAIENYEAPDFMHFFREFDSSRSGAFNCRQLRTACELLGVNGTEDEFADLVLHIWGDADQQSRGRDAAGDIKVTPEMFLRFCEQA